MDHSTLVKKLCKPGEDILATLTPLDCHLWHMASKLCSEAGELMDNIGKAVIYRKAIDVENAKEELGDIEFYLEGLRQGLSISRDETLTENIKKLTIRYGQKYSDQAAQERKDKQ